ncbi:hypothetical protein LTS72_10475 [Mycobacterium ostraviense]|uniref:hypothetical protein n=1 Tax=Mycobacterium ostraviense TaxID=2738409 RepID=UPI000AAE31A6|nr:hypothetical protein [Mycobacterium ostraviense]UGT93623.1 hypothetical protein LTS72_10475 [Mycobacterium ostraviense]
MKISKMAATAAMTGALGSAALGIGAGLAQADPPGPNVPGPVPGPNVPGPDPNLTGPYIPGQPICSGGPGVNCNGPGSPLPPGQRGAPPPGHYNEPIRYGLPATWSPPDFPDVNLPVVYNPAVNAWGVFTADGQFHVFPGAEAGGSVGGGTGAEVG